MIIKYILIILAFLFLIYFLKNRRLDSVRAYVRIIFILTFFLAIYSIMSPGYLTSLANFLGVGRGTDLVFYVCIVVGGYAYVDIYLKYKDVDKRLADLVIELALNSIVDKSVDGSNLDNRKE